MIEIKIMFKNGEYAYYTTSENIEVLFELIADTISGGRNGVLLFKELSNGKQALVNIREITSFGYSNVES